ncbi:MAG: hypothetical protein KatS3mg003_2275 [Candidatus Nitrosocaldaceae archaeon]|nr:MAG: hypothetical protein KatS3mg003_2275 [Candidatus Nitrosocaldaceae archaeon]
MILAYNIDERLIKRGEILLSLDFVDNYEQELALDELGRPYTRLLIAMHNS